MISLVGKDCEESAQGPPGTWKWLNLFISEREGMGREGKGRDREGKDWKGREILLKWIVAEF